MMKRFFNMLAAIFVVSCTAVQPDPTVDPEKSPVTQEFSAEKESWSVATKASDDGIFVNDIPWHEGDKVMLLGADQTLDACTGSTFKKTICTVSQADGLRCTLVPETPLEEGTYRAVYPVYDYVWYDFIHLSFLYEDWNELDFRHQDIIMSDPVSYTEGDEPTFVLKHICALVDIDIYPPKTGDYSYLKVFAESPVFAGKVDYYVDQEYNLDDIASGWLNFTTLRGGGKYMEEGTVFPTSTGLLPVQYDGMPMSIHVVYQDGTHYVSAPFPMPSLSFGVENKLVISDFQETDVPMQGLWGIFYGDPSPTPYDVN